MRKTPAIAALTLALAAALLPAAAAQAGPPKGNPVSANAKPPTSGRCAAATNRTFRGTVRTEDGRAVNVSIGFDLEDASGRKIDLRTGCPLGDPYSSVVQLNHWVGAQGTAFGTLQHDQSGHPRGYVTDAFALQHLPANAKTVYIETYTRDFAGCAPFVYTGNGHFTGCTGKTDLDHYGRATRRNMSVKDFPKLVLPVTAKYGGSTGTITVLGSGISRIYVRSEAPDGKLKLQGWGTGEQKSSGQWIVPALPPGQTYIVQTTFTSGREVDRTHVKVNTRKNTTIRP